MNLNIGGGAGWSYPGWLNLDQREGFRLSPDTVFPLDEAEIVYSSHCFEHLDDATVARMLSESRRVCRGKLVLKLPDFEQVLERWRAGDKAYFDQWGMGSVVRTWKNKGVEDTIDARAAMIFCGWWNDAYGDEWGKRTPDAPGAYHGPAFVGHGPPIQDVSPHYAAKLMRLCAPEGGHFNHQNAWSRAELCALLGAHGFEVESLLPENACELPIPGIADQRGISMYVVARPE